MSTRTILVAAALAACGPSPRPVAPPPAGPRGVEDGPHKDAIAAQAQPFVDAEVVSGLVIGVYDAGKVEIYGFGKGPSGKPPDADTLFELGSITKVYTSLLFADAVQRHEVELDEPVSDLIPTGVTVPSRDKRSITLKDLALHTSGLPRIPPGLANRGGAAADDPYGGYGEDALYTDLIHTQLESVPGTVIAYSNYGVGLLGFALGKKLGAGFAPVLAARVLAPLGLKDTFVSVPAALAARRATGTNDDLAQARPWTFDALAGAGALVSTARDQLRLIDAELDAAAGGTTALRRAMKLTQEAQLDHGGDNEGIGWQIDRDGRYWHNGSTGGFHAFIGFDVKNRRGVVILASTATTLVERLANAAYEILDGNAKPPAKFATAAQLAPFAGTYDLTGTKLVVAARGNRLYLEGPGEPPHRLSPISDHEFWIEALQSVAMFDVENGKVARVTFGVGDHTLVAPRAK